jgi:hypothetical protein
MVEPESEIVLQPSSPLPKQARKRKQKEPKLKRAPSLMEQLSKRQITTKSKSKPSSTTICHVVDQKSENGLSLDEFLSQSKENVFVPETPRKAKGQAFFNSPQDVFRSPTRRRSVKPDFVTPTKKMKTYMDTILQTPD